MVRFGIVFSPTKFMVLASSRELSYQVYCRLVGLNLSVVDNAKSFGGAISSGRYCNVAILSTIDGIGSAQTPIPQASPVDWSS